MYVAMFVGIYLYVAMQLVYIFVCKVGMLLVGVPVSNCMWMHMVNKMYMQEAWKCMNERCNHLLSNHNAVLRYRLSQDRRP